MHSLRRRLVVVVLCGLVAFGIAVVWRSRSGVARYAKARERANAACRAYRSVPEHMNANVCRGYDEFGPRAIESYRRADARLAEAEASLVRGDRLAAENALSRALVVLDDLARMGMSIAEMLAAKIVHRVLDLLAVHPEIDRASLLRNVHLDDARHPLEAARLNHLWDLAHSNELAAMSGMGQAALADEMEADDAAYAEMEEALLAGDIQRCERACSEGGPSMRASRLVPVLCDKLAPVVRAGRRLDDARRSP